MAVNNKKLNIEFIRSEFKKEGFTLLTKVYENNRQKLEYVCPRGHRHSVTWANCKGKPSCPYCIGNAKLTIEFIRAEFTKRGYTLLTKVYENNKQKLEYICSKGCKRSISWNNLNKGNKCSCRDKRDKPTIEFIRKEFKKEGYTLLTKVYKNNTQKLDYICPRGHKHSVTWSNWQKNARCPCFSNQMKPTIEHIRAEFAKEGYILLTTVYENNRQRLYYICPEGHRHYVAWDNWQRGQRCPKRSNRVSKWEKTIKKFLGQLNIDYIPNNRTQLLNPETGRSLELDLWMPKLNKAIECNGLFWHEREEAIARDKIKKQLCKDQGIDLLVVTDKEWNDDINQCKNKIQEFLC